MNGNQDTVWGLPLPTRLWDSKLTSLALNEEVPARTKLSCPVFITLPFLSQTGCNTDFNPVDMFIHLMSFQIESFPASLRRERTSELLLK